jgi:hypothetical protein
MVIPPTIEAVITAFDQPGKLDEGALTTALNQARQELGKTTDEIQHGAFAEVAAWHFSRADSGSGEPWGLYWTPVGSGVTADNKPFYMPDVADVDDEVLAHWIDRANNVQHPLMAARYADLAWEIGKYLRRAPDRRPACAAPQTTAQPTADLPRMAVDGYLSARVANGFKDEHATWMGLSRALMLATGLNDAARVAAVKQALFAHYTEREQARGKGHMMWWRLHDIVERSERALLLTPQERDCITASLRQALDEHADPASPRFDPHQAQNAADRLMKWDQVDQAHQQQIVLQAGQAFEHMAAQASAMLANSWLEDLIPRYRNANLMDDVVRIEQLIRGRAGELADEMVEVSLPFDVTREEMAEWADNVAGGSRAEGLQRLAVKCLQRPDQLAQEVLQLKVDAPLNALIPMAIVTGDGFTEATIGSVDNDLEGRMYQMAANHLGIDEVFVHAAFQRIEEKHGLTVDDLVAVIMASPFVGREQEHLIRVGLEAWKAGDAITAIHILVPQVEAAFRGVLAASGVAVRRPNPKVAGSKVIGFGEVLSQEIFKTGALKDIGFHLRALYTDPRALNLRNKLAHGLAHGGTLTLGTATMVVHSLLLVTLLVKQEAK